MAFGATSTTKQGENNLAGGVNALQNQVYPQAISDSNSLNATGGGILGSGTNDVTAGTNFFNTLLNGNQANTSALLAPSINQIGQANSNNLNAISTLMPRGGGRSAALFGQSFAPQSQIQNLFNSGRTTAATALPQIGLGEQGVGTNLFGLGNQALGLGTNALGTANSGSLGLGGLGQNQQQITAGLYQALGSGIVSLLQNPSGGSGGGGQIPISAGSGGGGGGGG